MVLRLLISALITFFAVLPCIVLSPVFVALMLCTKWDGRSSIFGNAKWGRANNHPINPTSGYWQEFQWLVWRNPVNNLVTRQLAYNGGGRLNVDGDSEIDNDARAGHYAARLGLAWEYYWIKPYGDRSKCWRVRIGWKLVNADIPAAFVFAINPIKPYTGA